MPFQDLKFEFIDNIVRDVETLYKKLSSHESIENLEGLLVSDEIRNYISSVAKGKPEEAVRSVFLNIFKHLRVQVVPEQKLDSGWIDLAVEQDNRKVGFELKPFITKAKDRLYYKEISFQDRKAQIQKYLQEFDYIILTNLYEYYLVSKQSIDNVEPFKKVFIGEFFERLENSNFNIVDTLRRLEVDYPIHDLSERFLRELRNYFSEAKGEGLGEDVAFHLINQLIMIRILEDTGAVNYKTFEDKFKSLERDYPSRPEKRLSELYHFIRNFFYEYFDTELLKFDLTGKMDSLDSSKVFDLIGKIAGYSGFDKEFFKGLKFYDFSTINEDIFGKSYEQFLAENRKEQGIFYTPSFITEYMAERLVNTLFDPLIQELKGEIEKQDINFGKLDEISEKIINIKIIDIACGSGAFLIKVFKEIYKKYEEIYRFLHPLIDIRDILNLPNHIVESVRYARKCYSKIFEEGINSSIFLSRLALRHIHGIDLDPKAVEIAKLNLWKEMIKINPSAYNYKNLKNAHVFPDLSLNIIVGNSLFDLVPNIDSGKIEKIKEIKKSYLENPTDLSKIEEGKELIGEILKDYNFSEGTAYKVFFTEVFEKGGFDGVIGNPPYVRQEVIRDQKEKLKNAFGEFFDSVSDLYTYFYKKSYDILREGGYGILITSNKWMRARYGEKLRKLLLENTNILEIVDFRGFKVFSEATVDTEITFFQKAKPDNNYIYITNFDSETKIKTSEELKQVIEESKLKIPQSKLSDEVFVLEKEENLRIKEKIERVGKPLKDWDVRIYRGVLTGFNEAF
ncbi:MAG: Eco57I restriction-modification methylase domain-containing protein, partial [Brevinematia bacterium]